MSSKRQRIYVTSKHAPRSNEMLARLRSEGWIVLEVGGVAGLCSYVRRQPFRSITEVHLHDHGIKFLNQRSNFRAQSLGSTRFVSDKGWGELGPDGEWLSTTKNFDIFAEMNPFLSFDARFVFHGCQVGLDKGLLQSVSKALNKRPVRAGKLPQRAEPYFEFWPSSGRPTEVEGPYQECRGTVCTVSPLELGDLWYAAATYALVIGGHLAGWEH